MRLEYFQTLINRIVEPKLGDQMILVGISSRQRIELGRCVANERGSDQP
jgi:hypothetical protein